MSRLCKATVTVGSGSNPQVATEGSNKFVAFQNSLNQVEIKKSADSATWIPIAGSGFPGMSPAVTHGVPNYLAVACERSMYFNYKGWTGGSVGSVYGVGEPQ